MKLDLDIGPGKRPSRHLASLFVHLIVALARLARPGGLRSVVAESVQLQHQLLILNRRRKRAPNLRATDRIIAGLRTLFVRPTRILRAAIGFPPPCCSTLPESRRAANPLSCLPGARSLSRLLPRRRFA
jgi:hypothetical protein